VWHVAGPGSCRCGHTAGCCVAAGCRVSVVVLLGIVSLQTHCCVSCRRGAAMCRVAVMPPVPCCHGAAVCHVVAVALPGVVFSQSYCLLCCPSPTPTVVYAVCHTPVASAVCHHVRCLLCARRRHRLSCVQVVVGSVECACRTRGGSHSLSCAPVACMGGRTLCHAARCLRHRTTNHLHGLLHRKKGPLTTVGKPCRIAADASASTCTQNMISKQHKELTYLVT